MIPKKPAPDLIRGGYRFSQKIMLQEARDLFANGQDAACYDRCGWRAKGAGVDCFARLEYGRRMTASPGVTK